MPHPELEQFKESLVKIVFRDGPNLIVKTGQLVGISDDFITLETLENVFLIRVSDLTKIQRSLKEAKT